MSVIIDRLCERGAHLTLEVHEALSAGSDDRHGLDPGLVRVGLAVSDHNTTNLHSEEGKADVKFYTDITNA